MPSSLVQLDSTWHRLVWSLKYRGLAMTALSCLANMFSWTGKDWYWKYKERQFDRRHQVDTGGIIPIESLEVSAQDQGRGWGYMATQPEWFHIVLSGLDIDYSRYTFVDFGSGKGRALMLASALPFKQIVGIEFCEALHQVAEENLASWSPRNQRCQHLRSELADATTFEIPAGSTILYFHNPFKADVMASVLRNISESHRQSPRHLVVVYVNPTCRHLLDRSECFTEIACAAGEPDIAIYAARGEGKFGLPKSAKDDQIVPNSELTA
jgi:hypothetical protein